MKVVILCGGLGTRLAEETDKMPKPIVRIGKMPILWHIMKLYYHYDYNEFYLTLGYKGEIIKHFFLDYHLMSDDLVINTKSGKIVKHSSLSEDWDVHLIDTGLKTNTGGRIKRLKDFLSKETFMMTYGDGVSNINIKKLIEFHRSHGKLATITAVRPPARFGEMVFDGKKGWYRETYNEEPTTSDGEVWDEPYIIGEENFDYYPSVKKVPLTRSKELPNKLINIINCFPLLQRLLNL